MTVVSVNVVSASVVSLTVVSDYSVCDCCVRDCCVCNKNLCHLRIFLKVRQLSHIDLLIYDTNCKYMQYIETYLCT